MSDAGQLNQFLLSPLGKCMKIRSGGGDEGIPSLRGQPDDTQNPPVWEPPPSDAWRHWENSQELTQRNETESLGV